MLTLLEFIEQNQEISASDLKLLEKYLDALFAKLGIDVEFSKHFLERLNDARNGKQITKREVIDLFVKEYKQYGKTIAQLGPDQEAVLTDMSSNINTPFVLKWNREKKILELMAKTVMRKTNFKPNNPKEKHFRVK